MNKNYYEILGIDKGADQSDIKKAYRELSKQHHPDKGGDEEKFKEINEAYSVLSNPDKRADYDNPMRNMGNPFEDMFNRFGGPFRSMRRPPDPNAPKRGRHIQMEYEAPVHVFILGGKVKVSFSFNDVCQKCGGKGAEEFDKCEICKGLGSVTEVQQGRGLHIQNTRPCPNCHGRGGTPKEACAECNGSGKKKVDREVVLPIPRGFRDGQPAGAAGQGGSGINGGPPGDLIVKMIMKYPKPEELTEEQRKVLEEL